MQQEEKYILLIEDVTAHAELFILTMERSGPPVRIDVIGNGQTALETFKKIAEDQAPRPDLVILDLNLPLLSGHDLLDYIRSTSSIKDLPVVISTCSAAPSDVERSKAKGISGYLVKPIVIDEIREILGQVFNDSNAGA